MDHPGSTFQNPETTFAHTAAGRKAAARHLGDEADN